MNLQEFSIIFDRAVRQKYPDLYEIFAIELRDDAIKIALGERKFTITPRADMIDILFINRGEIVYDVCIAALPNDKIADIVFRGLRCADIQRAPTATDRAKTIFWLAIFAWLCGWENRAILLGAFCVYLCFRYAFPTNIDRVRRAAIRWKKLREAFYILPVTIGPEIMQYLE